MDLKCFFLFCKYIRYSAWYQTEIKSMVKQQHYVSYRNVQFELNKSMFYPFLQNSLL